MQGEKTFTRKDLDCIADSLPDADVGWRASNPISLIWKPHRNTITGNYDANVLIAALITVGKEVVWFDRRKGPDELELELTSYGERLLGMIVNFPKSQYFGLWQGRHWVAIRKVEGVWYKLDSDESAPDLFLDGEDGLKAYLDSLISSKGEVILILNGDAPQS